MLGVSTKTGEDQKAQEAKNCRDLTAVFGATDSSAIKYLEMPFNPW